jgi:hypothetical protein
MKLFEMIERELHTPYSDFYIEDGIIFGVYPKGIQIDLEIAKYLVRERTKLCEGKSYLACIDARGVDSSSNEAQKYFSSEAGVFGITAGAFIVDSFLTRLLGNFYLKIFTPSKPAKLFSNKEEALVWLQKFK